MALIDLMVGFTFGALMLANKGFAVMPWTWRLIGAHVELLLVGWTAQLALGMAYWILPRLPGGSRGRTGLAWAAFYLVNLGVLLVVLQAVLRGPGWLLAGRLSEGAAATLFAWHAWERVRSAWHPVTR
jgi:hypothetical protein